MELNLIEVAKTEKITVQFCDHLEGLNKIHRSLEMELLNKNRKSDNSNWKETSDHEKATKSGETSKMKTPCKFYREGKCKFREKCRYEQHKEKRRQSKLTCKLMMLKKTRSEGIK